MKLTQMRYFAEVCQWGSITKAAERLSVSQPAVTSSIKTLEKEIGMPLLYRSKKRVVPTADGEIFLRRCRTILASVDSLVEDFHTRSAAHNFITVGVPSMLGYSLFPTIYSEFCKDHPEINVNIRECSSETAKNMVKNGELEFAIIMMNDDAPPSVSSQILGKTQLMYCVSPEHRLADRMNITFTDVGTDPLVLFSEGYYHQQLLRQRFIESQIHPNVLFSTNQVMTIKRFVREGIAGGFLIPRAVEATDHIVMLPFAEPITMNIAAIWQRSSYLTPEATEFVNFIGEKLSPT